MDSAERLAADERIKCLDPERELLQGERSLPSESALAQALGVLGL